MGKRYGQREIANLVFKNITTGAPVLYIDSAKVSSMEVGATEVFARGGSGNPKLIGWSSDKEITFKIEDALISPESLSVLAGTTVTEGDVSAHKKESFEIGTTTGAATTGVTLTETPTTGCVGTGMFLYVASNAFSITTALTWSTAGTGTGFYTFTGTHLVLGTATVVNGDFLVIDYYFTATGTKRVLVSSDQFAGYYSVEADTLWRELDSGEDYPALFTMPKVKLKDSWSISMEATGDPKAFTFDIDVYKSASNTDMVRIDILEGT